MKKLALCLIFVLCAVACKSKAPESEPLPSSSPAASSPSPSLPAPPSVPSPAPTQATTPAQGPTCADEATKDLVLQIADKDVERKFGPDPVATYTHTIENIREAGTDKETGKVSCEADLIRSPTSSTGKKYNDQVFPIGYTSEMTTEGKQYVTVFGLNAKPISR